MSSWIGNLKQQQRQTAFALALTGVFSAAALPLAAQSVPDFSLPPGALSQNDPEGAAVVALRSALPDVSSSPLAGRQVPLQVCAEDALGHKTCDMIMVELPLPVLNNPVGYHIQDLRAELAQMIETAPRGEDGQPMPDAIRDGGLAAAEKFERVLDTQSTAFDNFETLIRVMDLHYDVIVASKNADVEALGVLIMSLGDVIAQLEIDILTDAQKALQEARERLEDALESGEATDEEIKELTDALTEAMENMMAEEMERDGEDLSAADKQAMEDMKAMMEALKKAMEELGITPEEFSKMMMELSQGMQPPMPGGSPPPPQGEQPQKSFEELLEEMKQMLEQMQKMAKYIGEIAAITEEQQVLRDETLQSAIRKNRGETPPAGAPDSNLFDDRQQALRDRLNTLMQEMQQDGLESDNLGVAGQEMGEAKEDLDNKFIGEAVPDMDEALEALKASSEAMAMAMAMMMPGNGDMPGNMDGSSDPNERVDKTDVIDESGAGQGDINLNEALGIKPDAGENGSRDVRDRILESQRRQQGGTGSNPGHSEYLDRLLGPQGME